MTTLTRRPDPFFPSVFDDFFDGDSPFGRELMRPSTQPAVNIRETENNYQIEVAAPGIPKEQIKVHVDDDMLVIEGENRTESTDGREGDRYTRREFSYTSFNRSFRLPKNVDPDKIKVKYDNGILALNLPKNGETNRRRDIKF